MGNDKALQTVDRERKYSSVLCTELENLLLEGLTVDAICKRWRISRTAFYQWLEEYPEFEESYREGKYAKIAKVAGAIYQSALGYTVEERTVIKDKKGNIETTVAEKYIKPSVTAQKHLLATQSVKADKWKDTQEINVTRKLENVLKDISNLEVVEAEIVDEDIDD